MEEESARIAKYFRLFASTISLEIVKVLMKKHCVMRVGEITRVTHRPQPTISHHLAELVSAGVVSKDVRGGYKANSRELRISFEQARRFALQEEPRT